MKTTLIIAILFAFSARSQSISEIGMEIAQAETCLNDLDSCSKDSIYFKNIDLIGKKNFAKVLHYLKELEQQNTVESRVIINEIMQSMHYNETQKFDPFVLKKILPLTIKNFFGFNNWIKGKTSGRNILIEKYIYQPSPELTKAELVRGFYRSTSLSEIKDICSYVEPKIFGTRPGFKVKCGKNKVKLKFKEIHSEPFLTRILWALGFNTEVVDYHPSMKIKYDRRIFEEFNKREGTSVDLIVIKKTIHLYTFNPQFNAFDYVKSAVLVDGSAISKEELIKRYENKNESDIDYIHMSAAQLQGASPKNLIEIGPWNFSDFDHSESKVLRGFAAISAWLSFYDIRRENLTLALEEKEDSYVPKFIFADVGSALGKAQYRVSAFNSIENIKDFRAKPAVGKKLYKVEVNEHNDAFRDATRDDFREGLKLINSLTDRQIKEALIGSGYEGEELKQMIAKLTSRRSALNKAFEK